MAEIAIFIMGADMLLLKCLAVMRRLAMKYSKFKLILVGLGFSKVLFKD